MSEKSPQPKSVEKLSELELESIEYFISFVQLIGLPKSTGEIYGLLFVSSDPIDMDGFVERLRISKGSASQGLALLRNLGAVQKVYVEGERKDYYEADFQLSRIAKVFFQERLEPRFESGLERLNRMEELAGAQENGSDNRPLVRVKALRAWQERGQKILPWILKALKK